MRKFAEACERIAGTTKKLEKIAIVADYLKSSPPEEASVAAVFLSGRPFPAWEETTLQVGGRLLWQAVEELSGQSAQELTAAYRKHGDLGAAAAEVYSKLVWGRAQPPVWAEQSSAVGKTLRIQSSTTVSMCEKCKPHFEGSPPLAALPPKRFSSANCSPK